MPSASSEKKSLSRGIVANVEVRGEDVRVWFGADGMPRHVLLMGIQEKANFLGLVQRCEARVDLFVDGQAYVMAKTRLSEFLAAADGLFREHVPVFDGKA